MGQIFRQTFGFLGENISADLNWFSCEIKGCDNYKTQLYHLAFENYKQHMSQDRNNHDNKNLFSGRITISDVVRTSSSLTAEVPGIFLMLVAELL